MQLKLCKWGELLSRLFRTARTMSPHMAMALGVRWQLTMARKGIR